MKSNGNQERVRDLLAQGLSPKMIAKRLGIKPATVYVHIHRLKKAEQ